MDLLSNKQYLEDVRKIAEMPFDWDKFKASSIMISGATGMIGSFLIDVIMYRNAYANQGCTVYALGRSETKASDRFGTYMSYPNFKFVECDILNINSIQVNGCIDYIFHFASNTHPVAYATDPIGTVTANIIGTKNLLDLAKNHNTKRFVFASTVEIYGENRGDCEKFTEDYCGYINCNTLRSGYPESKRAGEALCQAYIKQYEMDIVIPRFSRTYGPTMLINDSKAISQFIKKGVASEDIVLKSDGKQLYSYSYVADAVSGALKCLFDGVCGEAYNIADESSDISLKNLAQVIAEFTGKSVMFELPDETENMGYGKVTKALMDSSKLKKLGWESNYNLKDGITRTIEILKEYI